LICPPPIVSASGSLHSQRFGDVGRVSAHIRGSAAASAAAHRMADDDDDVWATEDDSLDSQRQQRPGNFNGNVTSSSLDGSSIDYGNGAIKRWTEMDLFALRLNLVVTRIATG
jgi:hypothetical protein